MMTDRETDLSGLDDMLRRARADRAAMPDRLRARVMSDAFQVQAGFAEARKPDGAGLWRQFRDMLGGWPGLGGLTVACAAGIWIGLSPPAFLPDPVSLVVETGADASEFFDEEDLASILSEAG